MAEPKTPPNKVTVVGINRDEGTINVQDTGSGQVYTDVKCDFDKMYNRYNTVPEMGVQFLAYFSGDFRYCNWLKRADEAEKEKAEKDEAEKNATTTPPARNGTVFTKKTDENRRVTAIEKACKFYEVSGDQPSLKQFLQDCDKIARYMETGVIENDRTE